MRTWFLAGACLIGCGGTSFEGSPDATSDGDTNEVGGGTDGKGGADGSSDAGYDATGDSSIVDAGLSDVMAADGACECVPYWCGCGACDPALIACTVDPPACTRGCVSSCPELSQVTCTCNGGRCSRHGVDASTIGCLQDEDCPLGDCCAHEHGGPFCATAPNPCCGGALCP